MTTMFFSTNTENTADKNLYNFIKMCKDELTVFGTDLNFDDNIWDITSTVSGKQNTNHRLIFSNFDYSKNNNKLKSTNILPMNEPFLSFAKAYVKYKFGLLEVKSLSPLITVLRLLEKTLNEMTKGANPIDINMDILTRASQIGAENYTQAVMYRLGSKLEEIGNFLSEKRISKVPVDWKNPIKRPSDSQRVGKIADENRNKKMPSQKALEILPEIFFNATEPKELIVTSIIAILLGAPNRIGEVFLLPYNCEVIQKDLKGNEQYGLRWYPEKGADPMIKWIIPSMVDTIKLAVKRIKELTMDAREIAKWYELNPNKLFLPTELEYLRKIEYIDSKEASQIIFNEVTPSIISFFKTHKIPYKVVPIYGSGKGTKKTIVLFSDFERAIINLLPNNFPYLNKENGLTYSDSLLIQRINEYSLQKSTLNPTINGFSIGFVNDALGGREIISSIFDKYGYREMDGSEIKVNTHQFRHYLNTLAQKGGVSQLDIAKWSGRKDIQQNTYYDHVTADEMLDMVRTTIGDKDLLIGPLANIEEIKKKIIISRDEYAQLKIRTAHRTDFGICIHDFSMMPCQVHMDCINCTELVCMKGDKIGNENIKNRKTEVEKLLTVATKAQSDGYIGAKRWIEHHSLELQKLTELCNILDNQNVPVNSFIQISNISTASQIEQAQTRKSEYTEKSDMDMVQIKGLLSELGGIL